MLCVSASALGVSCLHHKATANRHYDITTALAGFVRHCASGIVCVCVCVLVCVCACVCVCVCVCVSECLFFLTLPTFCVSMA